MRYSFVLPCRNEEKAIGVCIKKIRLIMNELAIPLEEYEIISSDSSWDKSPEIARSLGAKVVKHNKVGYGNAYLEGFKHVQGEIVILGDADDTYNFLELPNLLAHIDKHDLVLGERKYFKKGSMPFLNKYIGNPILSGMLRLFYRAKVKDAHTGFRVIKKSALDRLNLQTTGMEFASEMIVKAFKLRLRIKEVPINYHPRRGETKLRRFRDAWRHIRFLLLYSPLWLFFLPGLFLFFLGLIPMILLYMDTITILGIRLFYHPMFLFALLVMVGYQLIIFSLFAKTYAITHLGEKSPGINFISKHLTIERTSIIGLLITLTGIIIYAFIFSRWMRGESASFNEIKNSIVALTLIVIGIQTISSSFMLSILGIKEN